MATKRPSAKKGNSQLPPSAPTETHQVITPKKVKAAPPPPPPLTHLTVVDWLLIVVFAVVSLVLRLYNIEDPPRVVFDEVHFGKFTNYYLRGTYFFDLHPPLAKLVLAAVCWFLGYDGSYPFYAIGDEFAGSSVPFVAMRAVSAINGGLLAPVAYWILREMDVSILFSCLAAVFVSFDNALITQSRYILLDAQLLLPIMLATLSWIKFRKYRYQPFSNAWWTWLTLIGVFLGISISMKSIGALIVAIVGVLTISDLIHIMITQKFDNFLNHFAARAVTLILLPLSLFAGLFYLHFVLLPISGPGDAFMSTEFQATLKGSSYATSPKAIAYGSIATFRNVGCEAYLHSNITHFPNLPGKSVVSSVYARKENNYWRVVPADGPIPKKPKMITNNSLVRLQNVGTKQYLASDHSHHPQNNNWNLVYGVSKQHAVNQSSLWKISYDNTIEIDGGTCLIHFAQIKFTNEFHHGMLVTRPRAMPQSWANGYYEVGTTKSASETVIWNVVEHNNTALGQVPPPSFRPSFFQLWIELLSAMNRYNAGLAVSHPWMSHPREWAPLLRGISFYSQDRSQIYLLGNPFIWWSSLVGLGLFVVAVLVDLVQHRVKGAYDNHGFILLAGWVIHYLPFFAMNRSLFLHHYFAALLFNIMLLAFTLDYLLKQVQLEIKVVIVVVLSVGAIYCFHLFACLTYGWPTTLNELKSLQWLSTWDIVR